MKNYHIFTEKARLEKGLNSLYGIWKGIEADNIINSKEIGYVKEWMNEHAEFNDRHPFNEISPKLNLILEDGIITKEEYEDFLWFLNKLLETQSFYDIDTTLIQELQGIITGIVSDEKINNEEIFYLNNWIEKHSNLKTRWPYDEIEALLTKILADNIVTNEERMELLKFLSDFDSQNNKKTDEKNSTLSSVCVVDPVIEFSGKFFCCTGEFRKYERKNISKIISDFGGNYINTISKKTDYLIVGAAGNPCWAYACYGRKIEQVMKNRINGSKTLIVHENDFLDAIEDYKSQIN